MIEPFQPSIEQLSRLSEDAYQEFLAITGDRIAEVEAESPIDLEVADEDRRVALADLQADTIATLEPEIDEFLAGGTLANLENSIGETISASLLLAMLLAVGGLRAFSARSTPTELILDTRSLISGQLRATRAFGNNVADGQLTERRIRDQVRRRALAVRSGFSSAAIIERMTQSFHNEGKRFLTSPHPCPDCPGYERLDWAPLGEIVPVATFCVCGSNCKCRVVSRFNAQTAFRDLISGNLLGAVQRRREFLAAQEQAYLQRHGWL